MFLRLRVCGAVIDAGELVSHESAISSPRHPTSSLSRPRCHRYRSHRGSEPLYRPPFLLVFAENPPLGCLRPARPSTRPHISDTSGSINSKARIKRIRCSSLPHLRSLPSLPKSSKPSSRVLSSCAFAGSKTTVNPVSLRKAWLESPAYASSGSCPEENLSSSSMVAGT